MIATEMNQLKSLKESRENKLLGLIKRGGPGVADRLALWTECVFGFHFVDEWQNKETGQESTKSRLVIQAFKNREHRLLTDSPTVQRSSKRQLLTLPTSFLQENSKFFVDSRDVI